MLILFIFFYLMIGFMLSEISSSDTDDIGDLIFMLFWPIAICYIYIMHKIWKRK